MHLVIPFAYLENPSLLSSFGELQDLVQVSLFLKIFNRLLEVGLLPHFNRLLEVGLIPHFKAIPTHHGHDTPVHPLYHPIIIPSPPHVTQIKFYGPSL